MDYELAKKLKDAGFPQKYINITNDKCKHLYHDLAHIGNCCGLYAPTLSELIEACGNDFNFLHNGGIMGWTATAITNKNQPQGEGKTPEEAVANLWLALQKN